MTRREFVGAAAATLAFPALGADAAGTAAPGRLGIAYTSCAVRMRQERKLAGGGPALPAQEFFELCHSFGAAGCQMDIAQLPSREAGELKSLRRWLDEHGMFLELSISGKLLEDRDAYASAAGAAQKLGVTCLRLALDGRRYEQYKSRAGWVDFSERSRRSLLEAAPMLDRHRLRVGIENHKDWLLDELADLLRKVSSPYLGACVDFGNNLALLEDSLELAEALAPFAVTTHVKDMAVEADERGFVLSEVPLGQGLLPLAAIIERLRRAQPDIHFCLEMITRDPLVVPCLDDKYWATRERLSRQRVEAFRRGLLERPCLRPLPRITQLDERAQLAIEDENIRRSFAYYHDSLGAATR